MSLPRKSQPTQLPKGAKIYLPDEAARKRAVEERLFEVFRQEFNPKKIAHDAKTTAFDTFYLLKHLPEQTRVTLADASESHSMNLGAAGQITTAIFLQANQRLDFDAEIMYSGCRPE